MHKKLSRAFEIYRVLLLDVHIPTKTTDKNLHEDSVGAYEFAFKVVHDVLEARQDTATDDPVPCDEAGPKAYELIEELKDIVGELIDENEDIGIDNLLRSLYEEASGHCGNLRRYSEREKEDEDEDEEKKPKKARAIKVPGR